MDWLAAWAQGALVQGILQIVVIVALVLLAGRGLRLMERQLVGRMEKRTQDRERLGRLKTLVQVGSSVTLAVVIFLAGLMILTALGINIVPLLAGAGIAGLALSLGAQSLVKDFIGGMLILAENQFTVGDVIQVGEHSGVVEKITLRATSLRDTEGRLHLVPNGEIRTLTNLTAGWSRAVVTLDLAYNEDMNQALAALEDAARLAAGDEAIAKDLLETPRVLGWVELSDWAVRVQLVANTRPGRQWAAATVLRQKALAALSAAGVRLARAGR